jgi:integrase
MFGGKKLSEKTEKLYVHNLSKLCNGDFSKLDLTDVDAIVKKLPTNQNTRRSYLISIVSFLKEKDKKLYDQYYAMMMDMNKELKVNTGKSDKQQANWVEWAAVEKLLNERMVLYVPKKKAKLSETAYNNLLDTLILALYVLIPPRRSQDYLGLKLEEPKGIEHNYLHNGKMYINKYKTAGTYKTQIIDVPDELLKVIKSYLKFRPPSEFFLVDFTGKPLDSSTQITRRLNHVFGAKISTSMLRNIYLTQTFAPLVKDLETKAKAMGTSVSNAMNQYIKTE